MDVHNAVAGFLRGAPGPSGKLVIEAYLREPLHAYGVHGAALPLGIKAGVPARAAVVPLASVLHRLNPGKQLPAQPERLWC